jgi:hypothetical protein
VNKHGWDTAEGSLTPDRDCTGGNGAGHSDHQCCESQGFGGEGGPRGCLTVPTDRDADGTWKTPGPGAAARSQVVGPERPPGADAERFPWYWAIPAVILFPDTGDSENDEND